MVVNTNTTPNISLLSAESCQYFLAGLGLAGLPLLAVKADVLPVEAVVVDDVRNSKASIGGRGVFRCGGEFLNTCSITEALKKVFFWGWFFSS